MTLAVASGLFFALALLGVPIVWTLLLTTVLTITVLGKFYPLQAVFLNYVGGVEPFHLVAVPLFIVAGELVSRGGVGLRIVQFSRALLGFLPGGLGIVTVASSMFFGAVSGSAIAASAAIGAVMIPGMAQRGYSRSFGAALVATSGTLGVIIPPSVPMLVYGFVGGVSIAELFISGIVPGLLFGLALMAVCAWKGRREGWDPGGEPLELRETLRHFVFCFPALLMPLIILGGIYSGVFTPTEAAAVAVVYGFIIAVFVYRDLALADLPRLLLDAFITSAVVMLVLGATSALAWLITLEQVPAQLTALVQEISSSRLVFLLLLNASLLVLGIFLEPLPALLLTAPLFIPTARAFGVDPVHLGLIMTCNLAIGLYTPPVGGTLFVAARIGNVGMWAISKALIPLFLASLVVLALVTYIPALPMALVHAYRGS
jgi:C4-dicarboxylate transporter, DctM subunit